MSQQNFSLNKISKYLNYTNPLKNSKCNVAPSQTPSLNLAESFESEVVWGI